MNTLYFKYAIEIEKAGTITKAAENLYMAQPNLSKAIKELETCLGYSIFDRTAMGMVPTEKGKSFLHYARNITSQIDELERLSEHNRDDVQSFRISIPRGSYIANSFTEFVLALNMDGGINTNIQETNSMQAIENVYEEKFNLGIIRYQSIYENYFTNYLKSKHMQYEPIWQFEYVLVMSKKHPLAQVPNIDASMLSEYVEISHGDNDIPYINSYNDINDATDDISKTIYVYERGIQFELLASVTNSYMWVSPIPESYLEKYGLIERACKVKKNKYKDAFIYRNGYKFTELDNLFKDKLSKSKKEVSNQTII